VAEARRSARRPLRLRRPRSATVVLIGINLAVFVVEVALGGLRNLEVLVRMGAMVPLLVAQGEYWRLFTAMFLHAGPIHLAFNTFALYLFGNLVEDSLGTARFLAVYLLAGLFASAASFALNPPGAAGVGASGAVFGLLGAWLAYNLRRRSLSLAQANIRGALMLIGINLVLGLTIRGVDNVAHIGGLVAGLVAGFAGEGIGRGGVRRASQVLGLVAVLGATVGLTLWRAGQLAPLV
jgi:rhomboid protease GluP